MIDYKRNFSESINVTENSNKINLYELKSPKLENMFDIKGNFSTAENFQQYYDFPIFDMSYVSNEKKIYTGGKNNLNIVDISVWNMV